jgi:AraC-like DNA-binding protein
MDTTFIKRPLPSCYITGTSDRYYTLEPSSPLHSFGIAFKPYAFALLFGWDQYEFHNTTYGIEEVFGIEGKRLIEQLSLATEGEQRVHIVENFLLTRLKNRQGKTESPIIVNALRIISQHQGMVSVHQLHNSLHISERHLERIFRENLGMGPKKWANLIRFIHVMQNVSQGNCSPLTLTAWLNFFDHSHFYRDFLIHSGEHFGEINLNLHPLYTCEHLVKWDPDSHPLLQNA